MVRQDHNLLIKYYLQLSSEAAEDHDDPDASA